MKIKYEPHPVTPERKAELRAAGYKIIDAKFAPKSDAQEPALDLTREGIAALDKAALIDLLEAHGVTPDKRKGQAALAADLIAVVFVDDV